MEIYRKSWKTAEEERNAQISIATTEVRTNKNRPVTETRITLTRGKRIATSPAETTPATGKKIREEEPNE